MITAEQKRELFEKWFNPNNDDNHWDCWQEAWETCEKVMSQGQPTTVLPEQKYKKVVYVKVKGKHGYEVHNYVNTVEEDNATVINNVKAQLKEDKVDVVSVFVAEKI